MRVNKEIAISVRDGKADEAIRRFEQAENQYRIALDRPTAMRAAAHLRKAAKLWEEIADLRK